MGAMAKRTIVETIDDLTGDVLHDDRNHTQTFALNGATYEIDLSDENAQQLEELLAPYISAGRLTSRPRPAKPAAARRSTEQLRMIREWARENGWPNLGDRGRIPAEAEQAFHDQAGKPTEITTAKRTTRKRSA